MQTYIVYLGLFGFCFLTGCLAEKRQKKWLVWAIVLALSLVSGLRKYTVGLDTEGYMDIFRNIIDGNLDRAYGVEWSFRYICAAMSLVLKDPQLFLLVFALLTNGLIVFRLWSLRTHIRFSWAVLAYLAVFYMMSLNTLRQFVAVAIVFYATKDLMDGKNIRFLVLTIIASLFHKSALLGVGFIFINIPSWKFLTGKQRRFIYLIIVASPLVLYYIFGNISRYLKYFQSVDLNIGLMIGVKMLILLIAWKGCDMTALDSLDSRERNALAYLRRVTFITYLIGLTVSAMGYVWEFIDRAGQYFYVFEAVYVGMIFKQKNTRNNFFIKLALLAIVCYHLYGAVTGNGQGQWPYLFYWQ